MKRVFLALVLSASLLGTGCASAPNSLSPVGVSAFNKTRVVQSLDLVRDVAITANNQVPPVISTKDTRAIVAYHRAALKTIAASDAGWQAVVKVGLSEVVKTLAPATQQLLNPYVHLANVVLEEVLR